MGVFFELKTYNGTKDAKQKFYIQSKGLHSGRPLKEPIPNCFAVYTDIKNAYEIAYCIFKAKLYRNLIMGSVVPFIRIREARDLLTPIFLNYKRFDLQKLGLIEKIDSQLILMDKKQRALKEMQLAMAHQLIRQVKN